MAMESDNLLDSLFPEGHLTDEQVDEILDDELCRTSLERYDAWAYVANREEVVMRALSFRELHGGDELVDPLSGVTVDVIDVNGREEYVPNFPPDAYV